MTHCHVQLSNAAKAALETIPGLSGKVRAFRLSPPKDGTLPQLSVYVARARNAPDHDLGPDDVRMRRDADMAVVIWMKSTATGIDEEAGRLAALAEAAMATSAGLKALVSDGLVWCAESDLRTDENFPDLAVLTLTYPVSVFTRIDDAEVILN